MIEYLIVSDETIQKLQNSVNHWIKYGYKPQGGTACTSSIDYDSSVIYSYLQAMIKEIQCQNS